MPVPAAHLHVTELHGVTLPANARAQKASLTETIELVKIMALGIIVKLLPKAALKKEVSIDYIGTWNPTAVTVAEDLDPATVKVTKASSKESNGGPVAMNITATADSEFIDGTGDSTGTGDAEPTGDTITLKSCALTLAESVDRSVEVKRVMVPDKDGIPAWSATCNKEGSFSVRFKGDLPTGIALGTSGAGIYGFTGGVVAVPKLMQDQTEGDVNGGSFDGVHAPGAA